ncbi:hypothetical protein GDO86_007331 [Hymenochirus boettgeri]|uniref:Uncharacterized protein n=1 Tax=Hymenochirus boettgeri TaxID=247094 RepID=A0A8T2IWY0_9PIPI|nr:hypothetical protein GDO86_007331 [Hymenochirus boettgeri]
MRKTLQGLVLFVTIETGGKGPVNRIIMELPFPNSGTKSWFVMVLAAVISRGSCIKGKKSVHKLLQCSEIFFFNYLFLFFRSVFRIFLFSHILYKSIFTNKAMYFTIKV